MPSLMPRVTLLAALALAGLFPGAGCTSEDPEPRPVAGHDVLFGGVTHAEPARFAEHYCVFCHGDSLGGGEGFEPSCYTCHGRNWLEVATSRAPIDHTVEHDGYRHHPNLLDPQSTCTECHGADLSGDAKLGRPGCELCHERLWEQ